MIPMHINSGSPYDGGGWQFNELINVRQMREDTAKYKCGTVALRQVRSWAIAICDCFRLMSLCLKVRKMADLLQATSFYGR